MLLLHNAKNSFPKSLVFTLFQIRIIGIYTHRHTHILCVTHFQILFINTVEINVHM